MMITKLVHIIKGGFKMGILKKVLKFVFIVIFGCLLIPIAIVVLLSAFGLIMIPGIAVPILSILLVLSVPGIIFGIIVSKSH